MPDDMVAELTLRIINEMNGGIDQVKGELQGVQDAAVGLTGELGDLSAIMAELRGPAQMVADMKALDDSVAALPGEINAASQEAKAFGLVVDEDTQKIKAMVDSWKIPAMIPPNVSGEDNPPFIPPGTTPPGEPPDEPPDEPNEPTPDEPKPRSPKEGKDGASMFSDFFLGGLAFGTGYESFEKMADYDALFGQITNTEKIHGDAAQAEQSRLHDMMDKLAFRYNQSSEALADAYLKLIMRGIPAKQLDSLMPSLAEAATAHNIDVNDLQGAVFALSDNYRVPSDEMGAMLGQLGAATKMGHFDAASFGLYLPQIGGALNIAGVTGQDAADNTLAAMETIIKSVSIPSEAATDYTDFIHYIGTQHAERQFLQKSRMMLPEMRAKFAEYGIGDTDLWQMENSAVAEGKNPVETVLDYVQMATSKMTPIDRNAVISDWFTNQQGGDAVRGLVDHWNGYTDSDGQYVPGYQEDRKALKNVTQSTLDDDFKTAVTNASADLNTLDEAFREASRGLGHVFDFVTRSPAEDVILHTGKGLDAPYFGLLPTSLPSGPAPGMTAPGFHEPSRPIEQPSRPIDLHLTIHQDGTVKPTPGHSQPGVNLKVNQGNVLAQP